MSESNVIIINTPKGIQALQVADQVDFPIGARLVNKQRKAGIMIDCARVYYAVQVIKDIINTVRESGGQYLHLHMTDYQAYGYESVLLGQTTDGSTSTVKQLEDGSWYNEVTKSKFYSVKQLQEIANEARRLKISLIPELDTPAHSKALLSLYEAKYGTEELNKFKSQWADEVLMTEPKNVRFVKRLITEVINIFGEDVISHFHMGCDEFGYAAGYSEGVYNRDNDWSHEVVEYANSIAKMLKDRHIIPRMWNDGLTKTAAIDLDRDIEVCWWSWDGQQTVQTVKDANRYVRMDFEDLLRAGIKVVNCNAYYTYLVPNEKSRWKEDSEWAAGDITRNWHLGVWDQETGTRIITDPRLLKYVVGSQLSIWGDHMAEPGDKVVPSDLVRSILPHATNLAKIVRDTK